MVSKRVVIAGGNGFLGRALSKELAASDYETIVLTRSPAEGARPAEIARNVQQVGWDGKTPGKWAELLEGAEAVVNLAGKSVNCRYTEQNRKEIIDSRVDSVNAIAQAILRCRKPPKAWIQASSLAIYGDAEDRICDESAAPGDGFSAKVCVLWEDAFVTAHTSHTRKVVLRIGFVLALDGGALEPLKNLARFYLGGTIGGGEQYISWLHTQDMNNMFVWGIEREDVEGVFNATSPNPVTNADFMLELRRALDRPPWSPPTPAWAVRLGAKFMGTEADLALTGRRCVPKRFLEHHFQFKYPDLNGALRDLLSQRP